MNDLATRVGVLRGLTATELDTLLLRVRGRSIAEIARAHFTSPEEARREVAHLYDTLWIAHLPAERRAWELAGWSAALAHAREQGLLSDRFEGYVPTPPDEQPSPMAFAAVDEDELTLPPTVAIAEQPPRRAGFPGWLAGVATLLAIVVVSSLAILAMGDDDDGRTSNAAVATRTAPASTSAGTTPTATTGAGLGLATATATATAAATVTTPPEPTAPATSTSTATRTVTATTTGSATATTTAPTTATAGATGTSSPAPTATPTVIYSADWSQGLDGWAVSEGWRVEGGILVFDGPGGSTSAFAPVDTSGRDYAVEAELLIANGSYSSAVGGFALRDIGPAGTSDWQSVTLVSTGSFHRYRIEVRGQQATFLIDGVVVGESADPRYRTPEALGVYVVGTHAELRAFQVVSLQ